MVLGLIRGELREAKGSLDPRNGLITELLRGVGPSLQNSSAMKTGSSGDALKEHEIHSLCMLLVMLTIGYLSVYSSGLIAAIRNLGWLLAES